MSRDKSVWFAEEILLDAKLINSQLESGEWGAIEEMLRAEAELSRYMDTGRLRPKKASEYTLRLISDVLHIMRLDIEQGSHTAATLGVATQCLRLVRSCAAAGTKMQTYISKDLTILDTMLALATAYYRAPPRPPLADPFRLCVNVLMQTLANLVVNNPYNQIVVWQRFESVIVEALSRGCGAAGMLLYNVLVGQPALVTPEPELVTALCSLHAAGEPDYPHLVLEHLASDSAFLEKVFPRLDCDARALALAVTHNMLMEKMNEDASVSVNWVRYLAAEFRLKSDAILKTVDKHVAEIEPAEVSVLLDILCTASSNDTYLDALQSDTSLFINCAFLLRAIHELGKQSNNFFTSINKLYAEAGKSLPDPSGDTTGNVSQEQPQPIPLSKNDSADTLLSCVDTSECTESENSEQFYECSVQARELSVDSGGSASSQHNVCSRKVSLEHKIDMEGEPPLIVDPQPPRPPLPVATLTAPLHAPLHPDAMELPVLSSPEVSPEEPVTEIAWVSPAAPGVALAAAAVAPAAFDISPAAPGVAPATPAISSAAESPPDDNKRSQNLTAGFDLSEQLERILGTTSEKSRSGGGGSSGEGSQQRARQVPSVKIDSPERMKPRGETLEGGTRTVVTQAQSVEQHVAFGFKAGLVRLLANLCWKHHHNKRLARELELIPVLLDCCNIDARNPLIMQWVIFAVRNLCENCPENQGVIASLRLEGAAQNSVLAESGLELHVDEAGRRLCIAPLHTDT